MRKKYDLRMISAWDAMDAAREAAGHDDSPLWRNACVLARALYRGRKRVFSSGQDVMKSLPGQTVACWMRAYHTLCRAQVAAWQEQKDALARDAWGRLKWKAMRAMGRMDLTDGQSLYCVLQMILDDEERLKQLCPDCKAELLREKCPVCGAVQYGVNPNFDENRFEELKKHGLSDVADSAAGT